MKRIKLKIPHITALLMLFIFFCSCEKGPNFREFNYPAPVVNDFSPKQSYAGTDVTIEGSDFGTVVKGIKVYFGGVLADSVRSVEENRIVVKVPENGVSGIITVDRFGKQDTTAEAFTYLPSARIISISTDKALEGDEVTITGENFGTNQDLVQVFIGEAATTLVSVNPTEVKFTVPDVPSGNVILMVDGQRLVGPYLLVGIEQLKSTTIIGHTGSWGNDPATTIAAALDGNLETFIDGPSNPGFVGYDLGAGKAGVVKSVRFAPRVGYAARMVNGEIRGANDPSLTDYVVLHKITEAPPVGVLTEVAIDNEESYRYIYYYAPEGNCNLAEVEFYGNLVDKETPVGKLIWEFGTDGNNEGWTPQQSGTWTVSGGAMNVNFSQTSGKKRADFKQTILPVTVHTGNYPIIAIKFNKPTTCSVFLDTEKGSVGNSSNTYFTDYADKNVYYWDLSAQVLGGNGVQTDKEITFTSTFQFKVADIPEANPETGYTVQWIRSFANKQELENFVNN